MRKVIAFLISFCTVIIFVSVCCRAYDGSTDISIELGQSPDMSAISARVGDHTAEPAIVEQSGKTVWHIGSTTWGDENLYLDINDSLVGGKKAFEDVYLDVEYYDEVSSSQSGSFFEIRYIDANGAESRSETVWGKGSKEFVTASVKLTAPRLNNAFGGSDFVLTTRSLLKHGYAGKGAKISKISVRIGDTETPLTAKLTTDKTGNIMYDTDERKAFKCSINNRTEQETEVACTLNLLSDGDVFETHNVNIKAEEGETAFYVGYDALRYGAFTAELVIQSNGNTFKASCPFSYNRYSDGRNERIGACVHLGGNERDPIKTLELLGNSGIKWIRTDMFWHTYETEKGVYQLSPYQKACLENARKNNLKLYPVLGFGNPLYTENKDGFPKTEEQRTAFYNYVYHVVTELERDYADVIGAYELWNEPNLTETIAPEDYTALAKVTREAMNAANSGRELVGLAMSGIHDPECVKWCDDAYAAGLGQYVDGLSFHPYSYWLTDSPDRFGLDEMIKKLRKIPQKYGGATKVWISELGWPTVIGTSETRQAKCLVRSFLITMVDEDSGPYFIYQFQDGGNDPYFVETQFGIIRPWTDVENVYAAKKAYSAVANMNYFLGGKECTNFVEGAAYNWFRFEDKDDNSYTDVVYNAMDAAASFTPTKPRPGFSLTVYDMYGNEIEDISPVRVNGEPIYAVYQRETSIAPAKADVTLEQTQKYGSVRLSGKREGETKVDFIVLKDGKSYGDFLTNPSECTAYFNTLIPENGSFGDEFYIANAAGTMNAVLHYASDNTYEAISFDLTNGIMLKTDGDNLNCTIDYQDGEYDLYIAQYRDSVQKSIVRLDSAADTVPTEPGADSARAFLWEKGTMEPLFPVAETKIREHNFIRAGLTDTYKVMFEGISDDAAVGLMIYKEDADWSSLKNEGASGTDIMYFNEIPTRRNRYSCEYTFRQSGLYRVRLSDFSGAELNNMLVLYASPTENVSAMEKLLAAAEQSQEAMMEAARKYRYELLLYYPNTDDFADRTALTEIYRYIRDNEVTASDGKIISDFYNQYISENEQR